MIKLRYGVRDRHIISISELTPEERGLNCNCTCPSCGDTLIARLGDVKQHHFAHTTSECNIAHAQQTALHLMAKEIIAGSKEISSPAFTVSINEFNEFSEKKKYYIRLNENTYTHVNAKIVKYQSVTLEKRIADIVPDIMIESSGKQCFIEIAVTHFVDHEKTEKIKGLQLPTFEINLSSLYDAEISREELKHEILYNDSNRYWIYYPKADVAKSSARAFFENKLNEAQLQFDEEYKRSALYSQYNLEQQQRKKCLQENAQAEIDRLFIVENYKQKLLSLRNNNATLQFIKKQRFFRYCENKIPFYVDIPITGEFIFSCDRRIWQSAIFNKFVFNRRNDAEALISAKRIQNWLCEYQNEIRINWKVAYSVSSKLIYHGKLNTTLLSHVIERYLYFLHKLGFISAVFDGNAYVRVVDSVCPPNFKSAKALEQIISEVDTFAPDIDYLIDKALNKTKRPF